MCKQPINILNPKLKAAHSNFNIAADPLYLTIPCGKCAECQIRKQQDWITRLAYEYQYTLSVGGYALFETFTYAEENVPRLHGLMCFNRDHYTDFANKLRTYLVRHYEHMFKKNTMTDDLFNMPYLYSYDYSNDKKYIDSEGELWEFSIIANKNQPTRPEYYPAGKIKIFFVSEYGGEYKRPHHHAIIFVQYKIRPVTMCYYIKKAWIYGFTGAGDANSKIVNSMRRIAYCAKYVCKDIEWAQALTKQKNSTFLKYIQTKWQQIYDEPFNQEEFNNMSCDVVKKVLKEIGMEKAIPFIRTSRHLGEYGIQLITNEMLRKGQMVRPDTNKGQQVVSIPDYLARKMLYDYDKNIKYWQLNEHGKVIKAAQQEARMENIITSIENVFTYWISNLDTINPEYYKKMYSDIKKNKRTWGKLIEFIYERNKIISDDIVRWIQNGDMNEMIQQEKKAIMDTIYVTKNSAHVPITWILEEHMKKKILTVTQYLDEKKIKDERFKEIMTVYDYCIQRIRDTRNAYKQAQLEAEHFVKLKYKT